MAREGSPFIVVTKWSGPDHDDVDLGDITEIFESTSIDLQSNEILGFTLILYEAKIDPKSVSSGPT